MEHLHFNKTYFEMLVYRNVIIIIIIMIIIIIIIKYNGHGGRHDKGATALGVISSSFSVITKQDDETWQKTYSFHLAN